jgi:hypothetical protein
LKQSGWRAVSGTSRVFLALLASATNEAQQPLAATKQGYEIMRIFALLAAGGIVLSGCTTDQDRSTIDDGQCRSYSAEPGSEAYVQCRMWAETERRKRQEFIRAELTKSNTSTNNLNAFCPGFERGYMNGYHQISDKPLSGSATPSCPVQPPKRGMEGDFDQGYEIGMERGREDARRE